jgi:hypothetical protein
MRAGRGTLALALSLGVLLLALAAPRLAAAVLGAPADRVVFYLERGQRVTDEALTGLIVARRAAAVWHETAWDHRDIAAAELMLAHRGAGTVSYEVAERALGQSLTMAPVDPHSWARLAHVAALQGRDARAVIALLRASIRTGRYEPSLAPWRVAMMLRLWEAGSVEDHVAFLGQIRQLAREDPESLAALRTNSQAAPILADLLGPPIAEPAVR